MSRDFQPLFFHVSNPSGPLINRYFQIRFRFRRDIKILVCITPGSQVPKCASSCWVGLHGVHHTAESNFTLQSQNRNLWESLVAFKGTTRRNPFRGENIYHERRDLGKKIFDLLSLRFGLRVSCTPCVMHTVCHAHLGIEFFKLCDQISQRNRNQIQKYLSVFIRAQME